MQTKIHFIQYQDYLAYMSLQNLCGLLLNVDE